jgi:PAS domain S-box-containing protein
MPGRTDSIAALLGALFADAPVGLAVLDAELRYVLVNDALAELNGTPSEEHLGRTIAEVLPAEWPALRATLERVLAGEAVVNAELVVGDRVLLTTLQPLREGEAIAGVGAVVVDITARRDVERARDEALALLDALFEHAPVGLGFWDTDLRFRRVNAALAEINGVSPAEHVGRTLAELLPGVPQEVAAHVRLAIETGDRVLGTQVAAETLAAPGVARYYEVSYYPVRDAAGEIIGAGAVCEDITEDRHARDSERYLRELLGEERAVLREVFARAPAGIALLWGPEHRFRLVNERFCEITGLRDDLMGRSAREVLQDLAPVGMPLLTQVRGSREALAREDFPLPGNRFVSFTLDPLSGASEDEGGVLFVVRDTTEQVRRRAGLETELQEERALAATLQRALLPRTLPAIPGVEIAARYEAAGPRYDVGGDFYDAFAVPGGWLAVVGDVCGKGPEAAALTAMCRYTLRAEASHSQRPAALLTCLNTELLRHEIDLGRVDEIQRFATVGCAALRQDGDRLLVSASCAGHPDLIVLRAGGATELVGRTGPPAGVLVDAEYADTELELARGDALILYTDGVLDAGAPERGLDVDDLAAVLSERAPRGAEAIAEAIEGLVRATAQGTPRDDYAVLVLAAV